MTKRLIFYYSININYNTCLTLSCGRILTAQFNNQGISNFLLVNQNLIPNKIHLSSSVKERITRCGEDPCCGGEEEIPDNLVPTSHVSLRFPVNCEQNHINIFSLIPIALNSALTWKLSAPKINISVSVCINQNDSEFKLGKDLETYFHTYRKD